MRHVIPESFYWTLLVGVIVAAVIGWFGTNALLRYDDRARAKRKNGNVKTDPE